MDTKKNNSEVTKNLTNAINSSVAYKIGKVLYYYEITQLAIIELSANIGVGEKIKFTDGSREIEHTLDYIKMDHDEVEEAEKGQTIAIEIEKKVKPGMEVYKI